MLAAALLVAVVQATAPPPANVEQALALHRDGRLDAALVAYRAVADGAHGAHGADAAGDPASAGTAHNNACVILTDRGELAAALVECRAAERIRRGLGDRFRLGRTLNNLARALQYSGEIDAAERAFGEALTRPRLSYNVAIYHRTIGGAARDG